MGPQNKPPQEQAPTEQPQEQAPTEQPQEQAPDMSWLDEGPATETQDAEQQQEPATQEPENQPETTTEPSELDRLKTQNAELLALLTKFTQHQQPAQQQTAPATLARTKALVTQRFNDAASRDLADVLEAFRAELREEMGREYAPMDHLKRTESMVMNVAIGEEERRVQNMLGGEGVQKDVLAKAQATVADWIKQGKMFPDAETAYRAAVQKQEAATRIAQARRTAAAQQTKQQRQQNAGFPANRGSGNRSAYGDLVSRAQSLSTEELMKELERLG